MTRFYTLTAAGLCLLLTGAMCPPIPTNIPPRTAGMKAFNSPEELRSYLTEQASDRYLRPPSSSGSLFPFLFPSAPQSTSTPAPASMGDAANTAPEADGDGTGFSTTNIQEIGVDESDIVKNNGQNIYLLDDTTIHIVNANPPENMTEIASLELEANGDSLYLNDQTLVAISQQYTYNDIGWDFMDSAQLNSVVGGPWNDGTQTIVTVIDVTDPAKPTVKSTVKFEGSLADSRMIDGQMYLIMTTTPRLPANITPETLQNMSLDQWIPDYEKTSADGSVTAGDIVDWQSFYRPEYPDGYGITTVVTLDVNNPDNGFHSTAVSADAGTIYATTEALYVTDTEYSYTGFAYNEDTIIHKFGFTENGTEYLASGIVPGRPLNQYSLGEHNDNLRIATTVRNSSLNSNGQDNRVYVLAVSETKLEIIGKIENIAPGESIYAARFIGNRGFLVTFKKVDPLFTIDFTDPYNPKLIGELKVPGYSDHIQLLDENHLLTIGKDALDVGSFAWFQGVQLSIFDVTDFGNPQLLHKEIIGSRGTHSEANDNPKAFNYYATLGVLAFPIDLYEGDTSGSQYGQHSFNGLYVYDVSVDNGFILLGRIATTDNQTQNGCFWGYYGYTRGVFIDQTVYAVSEIGVKAAPLDNIQNIIGQTDFDDTSSLYQDCYPYDTPVALPQGQGVR
ncbi:MAG: beta-propeller domain-containing protein [Planctomycetota bacterium]